MSHEIAKLLLETNAVHLKTDPNEYFTWTSGIRSPIYCDNRKLISHPVAREIIVDAFITQILKENTKIKSITGTATAGIPWASWIAHKMTLPLFYARSSQKGHGLKNAIEGDLNMANSTILIEDLVSTGQSSLEAVFNLRHEKIQAKDAYCIFTYGLDGVTNKFTENSVNLHALTNFETLIETAAQYGHIKATDIQGLLTWKKSMINH